MPSGKTFPIETEAFSQLQRDLGIRWSAQDGFWLVDTVIPVALVNSQISINAVTQPGILANNATVGWAQHALNAVIADTGALNVGNYELEVILSWAEDTNSVHMDLQHRNAANSGNITQHRFAFYANTQTGFQNIVYRTTKSVVQNERIRVQVLGAGFSVGQAGQASINWRQV